MPKWRRKFDIYESDNPNLNDSHAVVTRDSDNVSGKSFVARLYINHLGIRSNMQRALSGKHRYIYIGSMC